MELNIGYPKLPESVIIKLFTMAQDSEHRWAKKDIMDCTNAMYDNLVVAVKEQSSAAVVDNLVQIVTKQVSSQLETLRVAVKDTLSSTGDINYALDKWTEATVLTQIKNMTLATVLLINTVAKKAADLAPKNVFEKVPTGLIATDSCERTLFQFVDGEGTVMVYNILTGHLSCFYDTPEIWEEFFYKGLSVLTNFNTNSSELYFVPAGIIKHEDGHIERSMERYGNIKVDSKIQQLYTRLRGSLIW